jgi:ABC-type Na+ transport system ATPase subunit NatA
MPTGGAFAGKKTYSAGKTTTVEILEGFRQRTEGQVSVLGHDPATAGGAWRDRVGVVLQESEPEPGLSVRECLAIYAGFYRAPRDIDETIALVGLTEKAGALGTRLSGGQRRRLDFALALIGDPELIFLDEPTTGFDPSARHAAWEVVAGLRRLGKTVFLTTHYMDEAEYLADRIAVLSAGHIVAEGTPADARKLGAPPRLRPARSRRPPADPGGGLPLPYRTPEQEGPAMIGMALHLFGYDLRAFLRNRQSRFFTPAAAVIAGRVLAAVVIAVVMAAVLLGIGWAAYGAHVPGRTALALAVTVVIGAASFCCLGYALTSLMRNEDAALPTAQALLLPLYFISGVFVAVTVLPHWLADVAEIFPVRHLANALLVAYNPHTTGLGFAGLDLLIVAAWGAAGLLIALRKFSWLPLGR